MPCLKQKMLAVEYLLYVTVTDFPGSTFIALLVNLLLFYDGFTGPIESYCLSVLHEALFTSFL